jgi:hypothetical protein
MLEQTRSMVFKKSGNRREVEYSSHKGQGWWCGLRPRGDWSGTSGLSVEIVFRGAWRVFPMRIVDIRYLAHSALKLWQPPTLLISTLVLKRFYSGECVGKGQLTRCSKWLASEIFCLISTSTTYVPNTMFTNRLIQGIFLASFSIANQKVEM